MGYIIRHVRVHPDKIEMALFGRATLERFTLNEGVFATRQNWLPESDALQNSKGLLFEFSFGQLNTAKGKKRLLTREAFAEAAHEKIARPNTRALADQILFARE